MPDSIGVSSVLNDHRLTLLFNTALTFDLADAKVAAPANIGSIDQKIEGEASTVQIALIGDVDVRSFREDKNYIIDVAFQQPEKPPELPAHASDASPAPAASHAPAASPALAASHASAAPHAPATAAPVAAAPPAAAPVTPPAASAKPADEPPASQHSDEVAPMTAETFAQQAKIEVKPNAAPAEAKASPLPETSMPAHPVASAPAAEAAPKITLAASPQPPETPPAIAKAGDSAAAVEARRDAEGLRLTFSFAAATSAALFRRADTVWLVFDSTRPLDVEPIRIKGGAVVAEVSQLPLSNGQAIRIRLNRPLLPSIEGDDQAGAWTVTFADTMQAPTQPLTATRNITDRALANVTVALPKPGLLHRLVDPDAGDTIMVVTAAPPVRGFIKRQDFVEMSLLESIHGVVVRPNSDDVTAEIAPDRIILGKPGGLTLSPVVVTADSAASAARPIFDADDWRKNQSENFIARQNALVALAAAGEAGQRTPARIDLARLCRARCIRKPRAFSISR